MYQERLPYVASFQRQAISTATFTAKFPKIDSPDYLLVRSLGVSNLTTDASLAHVGLMYNNLALYVETLVLTTKTYFYKMKGALVVPRDYQVIIKFVGHASGDKLYANVTGEIVSYGQSS